MVSRTTTADLAIGGVVVPAGQPLLLLLAASGRDPTAFDDPGAVDPHRDARHLSFGLGRHACPGASLARDLVAMAVGTLLERCPGIESSGETPSWREELNIRGLAGLPVSFRRARGSAARTDGRRP